jgi:hypothetical protein
MKHMVNFHPFFSYKKKILKQRKQKNRGKTEEVNRRQNKGTEHIMRL